MIGILDYGCGNLRSLENALEALGLESCRVATPNVFDDMDRLILPGVGNFGHAMSQLRSRGLEEAVKAFSVSNRPILGICLGMQLMFDGSDEAPGLLGLGLLPGHFEPFTDPNLKVPHMGWSAVDFGDRALFPSPAPDVTWGSKGGPRERSEQALRPFQQDVMPGLGPDMTWGSKGGPRERSEQAVPPFQHSAYFVHTYFLPAWPENIPQQILGIANYGRPFIAAFRSGNLTGCQFHPEKSGAWGLGLLKEMTTW